MQLLEAQDVVKDFQGHRALNHVNVDVPEGSIFGLLGPNGAGKTTLIRIINQITAPDTGQILLKGKPLNRHDIYRIGYLPEERGLYKKMKVGEQALYLAQLKGLSYSDARKKLISWFKKFEIDAWWDKKVEELSKGMAQKVQFIITVLHEPELLIFDEPFSGFDPINVNILKKEILQMKENGATIIFSTHNMSSVEELCDHISLINKSETILHGEVNEVKSKYKSNIIKVGFEGDKETVERKLNKRFEIIGHKENGEGKEMQVKLPDGTSTNELISELVPLMQIKSFNEVIPSMNDIFIEVVGADTINN
ncbi:MAG TPA: ATP-binding cassette domain-containing protein [Bacteroidales bacterium]|nr:ATP-binding cassette domain-containing protein [Bacteroidales bacterium]